MMGAVALVLVLVFTVLLPTVLCLTGWFWLNILDLAFGTDWYTGFWTFKGFAVGVIAQAVLMSITKNSPRDETV